MRKYISRNPLTHRELCAILIGVKTDALLEMEKLADVAAFIARRKTRGNKRKQKALINHYRRQKKKVVKALRHKVILAMARGVRTNSGIAKDLAVSPSIVKTVIEDKSFDKHLTKYQKGVLAAARCHLEDKAERATLKLCDIIENGTPQQKIQLEAIKDLLDRVGLKPHEITEHISRQYSKEELDSMLKTTQEVEIITKRLRAKDSPYLIEKAKQEKEKAPSTNGPVPTS